MTKEGQIVDILIVDDNIDGRESLALLLKAWGHEVSLARDGQAGIDMAGAHPPDVVLLDIGLPDMNGYEVAVRLRAKGESQTPLLWAFTGYDGAEARRRSQEAGIDRHLVKPVDLDELQSLLAQAEWQRPMPARAGDCVASEKVA